MQNQQDAIATLSMLKKVAAIDGNIDEKEMSFMQAMAEKLKVDSETLEQIIQGEIYAEIDPPSEEWERIPYFQMCVMMTGINGDFQEKEALFCKQLGHELGLRDVVLEEVIRLFKKYFPKAVPIDALKQAYQLSHN